MIIRKVGLVLGLFVLATFTPSIIPTAAGEPLLVNSCQKYINYQKTGHTYDSLLFDMGFCSGYFDATWYYFRIRRQPGVCLPENVDSDQMVLVFLKYTDDHPELLNEYPADLVHQAFVEAWPCETKE